MALVVSMMQPRESRMSTALESMLKDFTARHGSVQAMSDGEGRLMLVLSQALVVNFIEDAVSDEVRVLAQAGRFLQGCRVKKMRTCMGSNG